MKKACVLFYAGLLLSGAVCAAPLFKWVDANGQVHYSDTLPPAGATTKSKPAPIKDMPVSVISSPAPASIAASTPAVAPEPAGKTENGSPGNAPAPAGQSPAEERKPQPM
jgi:hypothetical protein